jgi:N-acetylglucosamine-6-phosphate deacetylase
MQSMRARSEFTRRWLKKFSKSLIEQHLEEMFQALLKGELHPLLGIGMDRGGITRVAGFTLVRIQGEPESFYTERVTADLSVRGDLILPDRILKGACMEVVGGRIVSIDGDGSAGPGARSITVSDGYISPGFVDLHVHGGHGADYMDGTVEAVRTVNRAHLLHGTTSIFPTTTTGSPRQLERMIRSCVEIRDRWSINDGARIAGVHFYGPYFAAEKVGCHSVLGRRDPSAEEYERFFAFGIIRIATCAAELPGAEAFYQAAQKQGCLLTCGHSDANWTEMQFVTWITFGAR